MHTTHTEDRGWGAKDKKRELHISVVVLFVELTLYSSSDGMGRLNKCDRCEKGESSIALEHRKRKRFGQRFIFNIGVAKCLCLQNNEAV